MKLVSHSMDELFHHGQTPKWETNLIKDRLPYSDLVVTCCNVKYKHVQTPIQWVNYFFVYRLPYSEKLFHNVQTSIQWETISSHTDSHTVRNLFHHIQTPIQWMNYFIVDTLPYSEKLYHRGQIAKQWKTNLIKDGLPYSDLVVTCCNVNYKHVQTPIQWHPDNQCIISTITVSYILLTRVVSRCTVSERLTCLWSLLRCDILASSW